jgi:hypothetical protein
MTTASWIARAAFRDRPLVVLTGGILGLLVAMGIGRFAFTLLLPLMQREAGFGARVAGWLASANYLGYFAGSLTATLWPIARGTRRLAGGIPARTLTTAAMGLTHSVAAWISLRFLSGAASAWVFVFVSTLVLTRLRDAGQADTAGWIYGGVGVGIALTAALVLILPVRDSATLWIAFGALSAVILAAAAMVLLAKPSTGAPGATGTAPAAAAARGGRKLLLLAYSLEGIGYIVSATFIVAVINSARATTNPGPGRGWWWGSRASRRACFGRAAPTIAVCLRVWRPPIGYRPPGSSQSHWHLLPAPPP